MSHLQGELLPPGSEFKLLNNNGNCCDCLRPHQDLPNSADSLEHSSPPWVTILELAPRLKRIRIVHVQVSLHIGPGPNGDWVPPHLIPAFCKCTSRSCTLFHFQSQLPPISKKDVSGSVHVSVSLPPTPSTAESFVSS